MKFSPPASLPLPYLFPYLFPYLLPYLFLDFFFYFSALSASTSFPHFPYYSVRISELVTRNVSPLAEKQRFRAKINAPFRPTMPEIYFNCMY